mgnify:CR=1 FL=1
MLNAERDYNIIGQLKSVFWLFVDFSVVAAIKTFHSLSLSNLRVRVRLMVNYIGFRFILEWMYFRWPSKLQLPSAFSILQITPAGTLGVFRRHFNWLLRISQVSPRRFKPFCFLFIKSQLQKSQQTRNKIRPRLVKFY